MVGIMGIPEGIYRRFRRRGIGVNLRIFWGPGCGLKEYYEIINEARPLSGIFDTDADLFTEILF